MFHTVPAMHVPAQEGVLMPFAQGTQANTTLPVPAGHSTAHVAVSSFRARTDTVLLAQQVAPHALAAPLGRGHAKALPARLQVFVPVGNVAGIAPER